MRNLMKIDVPPEKRGLFLKDFLKNDVGLSARITKRMAMEKKIFNGKKNIRLDAKLKGDEKLILVLDREESQDIVPVRMDLDIVYEDSSMIVVNKPPYMVVHPTKSHQEDTLANGLTWYFRNKGDNTIVRLVSRLDMNTSGLVLIAKNQFTHSFYASPENRNRIEKRYLAIVHGDFQERMGESGRIDEPIGVDPENDLRRTVSPDGQNASTEYRFISGNGEYSLVGFRLITGRTHQIRVHTSNSGFPIVNDELYGGHPISDKPRQFLHAHNLVLPHPMKDEILTLTAELPEDMKDFLESQNISDNR